MKERPIMFSAPMVRAIREGRKTQTRRIVREPQPRLIDPCHKYNPHKFTFWHDDHYPNGSGVFCPYGVPGDRLWVREAWYYDVPPHKLPSKKPKDFDADSLYFRADGKCCQQIPECSCAEVGKPKWKPSIHLPRWASRLTLEITDVRVQRVRDIDMNDVEAEGVSHDTDGAFQAAWASINGPDSWDANPWVWAITFALVQPVLRKAKR